MSIEYSYIIKMICDLVSPSSSPVWRNVSPDTDTTNESTENSPPEFIDFNSLIMPVSDETLHRDVKEEWSNKKKINATSLNTLVGLDDGDPETFRSDRLDSMQPRRSYRKVSGPPSSGPKSVFEEVAFTSYNKNKAEEIRCLKLLLQMDCSPSIKPTYKPTLRPEGEIWVVDGINPTPENKNTVWWVYDDWESALNYAVANGYLNIELVDEIKRENSSDWTFFNNPYAQTKSSSKNSKKAKVPPSRPTSSSSSSSLPIKSSAKTVSKQAHKNSSVSTPRIEPTSSVSSTTTTSSRTLPIMSSSYLPPLGVITTSSTSSSLPRMEPYTPIESIHTYVPPAIPVIATTSCLLTSTNSSNNVSSQMQQSQPPLPPIKSLFETFLTNPFYIKDENGLNDYLYELGVDNPVLFEMADLEEKKNMANFLKKIPKNLFLKYLDSPQ